MLDDLLARIRRLIPAGMFGFFQPAYHLTLSFMAALVYRFPSRKIKVIAVTGTKGKSSTTEILNAILEEAGFKTALSNTIRFKVGYDTRENLYKMSMPGRFFIQRFIRTAVNEGCDYAVMEMTSQGALLSRHRFIDLDALVFTNLSPEHIEAHGSYEKYRDSKLSIARLLSHSSKKDTALIVNGDDAESGRFLQYHADRKIIYGLKDVQPYELKNEGIDLTLNGMRVHSSLSGLFNAYNIAAATAAARSQRITDRTIAETIGRFGMIPGRVEKIEAEAAFAKASTDRSTAKQPFEVIVDYAHTADSLEKLYQAFPSSRKICVLGGTGGGRDTSKRAIMGGIADRYCDEIILTDEDPYDEDPKKIVEDVAKGLKDHSPTVIMDRRAAIAEAIKRAKTGDTILITGKGTDPYIMGPNNSKLPWSDAKIAREELEKSLNRKTKTSN